MQEPAGEPVNVLPPAGGPGDVPGPAPVPQEAVPAPAPAAAPGGVLPAPVPVPAPAFAGTGFEPAPGPGVAYSAFFEPKRFGGGSCCQTKSGCKVCGKDAVVPAPLGAAVLAAEQTQAANARADFFVIYCNEWCGPTPALNHYGQHHLERMMERLPAVPFHIRVEPCADQQLNLARRAEVITFLGEHGFGDPLGLVEIAPGVAEGLYSDEIERVGLRFLNGAGYNGTQYGGFPGSNFQNFPNAVLPGVVGARPY
jgi:hypothetical protein